MSCSDCWKTCSWDFFRSIKNGQEERKLDFTKLFIKLLSLSDWSLAQVWETFHCSLLVFRRMGERMGLLAHQEEEEQFEREESRYHMYNSVAIVLVLTVFIAFLFCIGVIVLVLICYIMPFCVHWSYPAWIPNDRNLKKEAVSSLNCFLLAPPNARLMIEWTIKFLFLSFKPFQLF